MGLFPGAGTPVPPSDHTTSSHQRKTRPRKVLGTALIGAGALLGCLGIALVMGTLHEERAYQGLASAMTEPVETVESGKGTVPAVDWEGLLSLNAETVAWLTVEGTSISYPVVQPGESTGDAWYLSHDFWGTPSLLGCLYLDARASADEGHRLVFGHHFNQSTLMFSEIFQTYEQDAFDAVGTAIWDTPSAGATAFEPLMALTVDQSYAQIQRFSFETVLELRAWLRVLAADATALDEDWEGRLETATCVLTLVTCSSTVAGRRARTLLIFTA